MPSKVQVKKKNADLAEMAGENYTELEIGGRTYKLGAPTVQDHAKFIAQLKVEKMREAAEYIKVLKDAGIADEVCVTEYNKRIDIANLSPMAWTLAMNTLEGARHYFHASARKYDPTLSMGKVTEIITEDNYQEAIAAVITLMPQGDPEKNVTSGEK